MLRIQKFLIEICSILGLFSDFSVLCLNCFALWKCCNLNLEVLSSAHSFYVVQIFLDLNVYFSVDDCVGGIDMQ